MKPLFSLVAFLAASAAHASGTADLPRQELGQPMSSVQGFVVNGLQIRSSQGSYPEPGFKISTTRDAKDQYVEFRDSLTVTLLIDVLECYSQHVRPEDFLILHPGSATPDEPVRFAFRLSAFQHCDGHPPFQAAIDALTLASSWKETSRQEFDVSQCAPAQECMIRKFVTERSGKIAVLGGKNAILRFTETFALKRKADGTFEGTRKITQPSYETPPR